MWNVSLNTAEKKSGLNRSYQETGGNEIGGVSPFLHPAILGARVRLASFSVMDQAFAVGGMFVANVMLARVNSKEEYGIFALCYSVYTFLAGLHNALILEPYTVFGSGRYHQRFSSYARLMWKSNAALCGTLTALLLFAWMMLHWLTPKLALSAFLGMALSSGILLTAAFIRRGFYVQRKPHLAASFSACFFVTLGVLLLIAVRGLWLNSFTAFVIAAGAWAVAAIVLSGVIPGRAAGTRFETTEASYWLEHWRYARWVVATAFVFQLMTQGYYWLVAGFLSVKDLAGLRAMYLLVTPVDQLFVAFTLLILPMMAMSYARGDHVRLISLWGKYSLLFLGITIVFAIAVRKLSLPVLHLLYGGKFDELAGLLGMLVLVPVFMGVGNATNAALKAIERPNAVFYAYVTSGVLTFLVGIPLVIRFGLGGAVYGMLLSAGAYTVTLVFLWFGFLRKRSHKGSQGLRPMRITIIEPAWTNYRFPVYRELAERCQVDWIFSPTKRETGFGDVSPSDSKTLRYIEATMWKPFGEKFGHWQVGVIWYLLRERPDVVMLSADPRSLSFWSALILGRFLGIPTYAHGHGVYKKVRISWSYRIMMNLLLRLSAGYVAYAPIVREAFARHGFSVAKVRVAHNSIVNPCPVRPEEKTRAEQGILFLGRLRPGCGVEILLQAVKKLREEDGLRLDLHIIGGGEQESGLRSKYYRDGWVRWYGEVYDPSQIQAISRECFAGCYPGNAGLSVIHMMSLSLPVLVHNDIRMHQGPEPSFVRDGENGFLFDHSRVSQAIYEALKTLAVDRVALDRMRQFASSDYERLTNPSLATRLWRVFVVNVQKANSEGFSPNSSRQDELIHVPQGKQ
jgi:O-antigen/teichoic acid export membrane protein